MLVSESQLRSIIRASILKEQTSPGSGLLQILVSDVKANPQKYLSSKRDKLETITWKGKKYKALGFLEKGNPVALIKKSDLKPQDTSTSGPFQLLGKDKITIINSDDKRVYNLAQYEGGSSVPVFVRDNTKDVKLDIVKVDYGDPSSADWAIEIGSYIGMIPGVGTPVDLGSAVLAVIKDPPDYLLGALSVLCSAPILGLAAGAAKIAGKGVIKTGARAVGREIADEVIEEAAEALVKYLKSKDVEISEKVFGSLRKQLDGTLEYLEKQMKKFAQNHDVKSIKWTDADFPHLKATPRGGTDSVIETTKRIKELKKVTERFFNAVKAQAELELRGKSTTQAAYVTAIKDKARVEAGRASKQLFNSVVDRKFFEENVKFVHVVGAYAGEKASSKYTIVDWMKTNNSKNDISAYGFYKETPVEEIRNLSSGGLGIAPEKLDVVELEGRLTYYGREDVLSEKTSTATPEILRYYEDSGLPKRPKRTSLKPVSPVEPGSSPPPGTFKSGDNYYPKDTSEMVIDKDSFDARFKEKGENIHPAEAIISNWKVKKYTMGAAAGQGEGRKELFEVLSKTNFDNEAKQAKEIREFIYERKNLSTIKKEEVVDVIIDLIKKANILFLDYNPGYGKTLGIQEIEQIKKLLDNGIEVNIDTRYMGGVGSGGIDKIDEFLPNFESIGSFIDEIYNIAAKGENILFTERGRTFDIARWQKEELIREADKLMSRIRKYQGMTQYGYAPPIPTPSGRFDKRIPGHGPYVPH